LMVLFDQTGLSIREMDKKTAWKEAQNPFEQLSMPQEILDLIPTISSVSNVKGLQKRQQKSEKSKHFVEAKKIEAEIQRSPIKVLLRQLEKVRDAGNSITALHKEEDKAVKDKKYDKAATLEKELEDADTEWCAQVKVLQAEATRLYEKCEQSEPKTRRASLTRGDFHKATAEDCNWCEGWTKMLVPHLLGMVPKEGMTNSSRRGKDWCFCLKNVCRMLSNEDTELKYSIEHTHNDNLTGGDAR